MGIIFMVRADYECSKKEAMFLSLTLGPGGPMSPAGPLGPGMPSAPRTPLLPFTLRVEGPGRPGKPGAPRQKHQSTESLLPTAFHVDYTQHSATFNGSIGIVMFTTSVISKEIYTL